jgi:hypothetical protein
MMRKTHGPSGIKAKCFILKVKWRKGERERRGEEEEGKRSFKRNRVLTGFRFHIDYESFHGRGNL